MMRLRVENLGPLRAADVDLSHDLIVLTGPNNAGKTWFAWTVYGLMRSAAERAGSLVSTDMIKALQESKSGTIVTRDMDFEQYSRATSSTLKEKLPGIFGSSKRFFEKTHVHWTFRMPDTNIGFEKGWGGERRHLSGDGVWAITYNRQAGSQDIHVEVRDGPQTLLPFVEAGSVPYEALLSMVIRSGFLLPAGVPIHTMLFPAERLAVNLFARELSASRTELVDAALEAEANGSDPRDFVRRAGRFPLPIQDSIRIANRVTIYGRYEGAFVKLADELEHTLLGGSVRSTDNHDLQFSPAKTEIQLPMHMTASVVKSLASLTFYLRHLARHGDFVIIDEPELNLHPDAQRKVARFLGKLVNHGFKVMISTHSDFVVRELGHMVMLQNAGDKGRALAAELGYAPDTLVAPERLSAWLFGGGTAENIPVNGMGFGVRTIDDEIARMNMDSQSIYAKLSE